MDFFAALESAPAFTITVIGILGLLLGSFFNVVIYRLPKMMAKA